MTTRYTQRAILMLWQVIYRGRFLANERPHFFRILMNHNFKKKVKTDSCVHRML